MREVDVTQLKLQAGITGFGERGPPPYLTDLRMFCAHCHEAARRCQIRLVASPNPKTIFVCGNFAISTFEVSQQTFDLLINIHHPVIAFTEGGPNSCAKYRFRDCVELACAFREFGIYQVSSAAYWESKVTPESLGNLSKAELKQVAYWKPERLGDIAFNDWD